MSSDLNRLVAHLRDGMRIAVPVDYGGVAMSLTRPMIKQGLRDLDLVCVPTGGLQVDQLIGAGCVRSVETSAVSLGEAGGAPRFNAAVKEGRIKVIDATCPAVHAGLIAAQKGSPFFPMRGLVGTDVLRNRSDWIVIDNPFAGGGDPVVLIPAIKPDVAIFHAPLADRDGNVWIGRRRELAPMAYASAEVYVTVDRIVDNNLLADETTAAGVLPALYVTEIAHVPRGAWPYGLWGVYAADIDELKRYAAAAKTQEGFDAYMAATDDTAKGRP